MYFVYRYEKINKLSLDEVLYLRTSKNKYDLWIDLEEKEVIEKSKGHINLFSKKILGRLLCFLIINSNRKFTAEELFPPVWCLNVSDMSEEQAVKTSISRLRNMLENDHYKWKYIKKTDPSFLGRRGEYYFNSKCNYCLIQPEKYQIF